MKDNQLITNEQQAIYNQGRKDERQAIIAQLRVYRSTKSLQERQVILEIINFIEKIGKEDGETQS